MGRIYQQTASRFYFMDYRDAQGVRHRESTRTTDREEAGRVLKVREGKVAGGQPILPRADQVKYDELAADLVMHYATTGTREAKEAGYRLAHLKAFFTGRRAVEIRQALVTQYVAQRQAEQASNGTINRELAVLVRMLNLADENDKLVRVPRIRKLDEAAPRQGFFEPEQFRAVCPRLPVDLQVAAMIGYTFGWRMQSEILTLERRHLDLAAGTLRLDPGMTKNGESRQVAIPAELLPVLREQVARVDALQRKLGRIIPYLFPFLSGAKRAGTRRDDFRKAWASACRAAGVAGRLRHDLRRTAVRNMERESVPRSTAMQITGHKTEAMYQRYAIVSEADHRDAARRLGGIVSGIVRGVAVETRSASV
jgi:integrase